VTRLEANDGHGASAPFRIQHTHTQNTHQSSCQTLTCLTCSPIPHSIYIYISSCLNSYQVPRLARANNPRILRFSSSRGTQTRHPTCKRSFDRRYQTKQIIRVSEPTRCCFALPFQAQLRALLDMMCVVTSANSLLVLSLGQGLINGCASETCSKGRAGMGT
jgi:hypothetical protein